MSNYAFYGTLRDSEVLSLVAGSTILTKFHETFDLSDFGAFFVKGQAYPALRACRGKVAKLSLFRNLSPKEESAIIYFEGDEYHRIAKTIQDCSYQIFMAHESVLIDREEWTLQQFQSLHKASYLENIPVWMEGFNFS
ncbi:gamma-glutamylcyclotransferase family protein [Pseudobacteriovorax antillogorgiicola]|uniref:Gamma-glutamyl cyclotransferase, AIG2-like n=1 Tax=Pseudobacteriovorax antillogorgiicola TaxID=1513793 RepID=A0A1Y6B9J1_9BACT|nr:gamma-glutamylcyclotransferase family protein [Pseudobacteriovorax antillogorgiicola]TCS58513.1 hypothetical protein EDD56_10226 [Pseudobacteriovorax antillogorgiicola]SME98096.1 hypothetical protein SAMN06296036_102417 [Pseudobacteriovorax antillogorgiicola]